MTQPAPNPALQPTCSPSAHIPSQRCALFGAAELVRPHERWQVTWERTWPRWVGVACAVFGFANIVGALAGPPELWFPGIVIGSVWAAFGLRGGLPLFISTSQALPRGPERSIHRATSPAC